MIFETILLYSPIWLLILGSIYLASKRVDGWGWMLFMAMLYLGCIKVHVGG